MNKTCGVDFHYSFFVFDQSSVMRPKQSVMTGSIS